MSEDNPLHLGTLKKAGTVETPDGTKLLLETDQGEFLVTAESKAVLDGLSYTADRYRDDVMREGADG